MKNIINYKTYLIIRKRTTPSIMYYIDFRYEGYKDVIKIMNEMRKKYPHVLCFQVNWYEEHPVPKGNMYLKKPSVICMKRCKIMCEVSPYNNSDLNNLFQTVYNDCVCNFFNHYNKLLITERIIKNFHVFKLFKLKNPSYEILKPGENYENIAKNSFFIRLWDEKNNESLKRKKTINSSSDTDNEYLYDNTNKKCLIQIDQLDNTQTDHFNFKFQRNNNVKNISMYKSRYNSKIPEKNNNTSKSNKSKKGYQIHLKTTNFEMTNISNIDNYLNKPFDVSFEQKSFTYNGIQKYKDIHQNNIMPYHSNNFYYYYGQSKTYPYPNIHYASNENKNIKNEISKNNHPFDQEYQNNKFLHLDNMESNICENKIKEYDINTKIHLKNDIQVEYKPNQHMIYSNRKHPYSKIQCVNSKTISNFTFEKDKKEIQISNSSLFLTNSQNTNQYIDVLPRNTKLSDNSNSKTSKQTIIHNQTISDLKYKTHISTHIPTIKKQTIDCMNNISSNTINSNNSNVVKIFEFPDSKKDSRNENQSL